MRVSDAQSHICWLSQNWAEARTCFLHSSQFPVACIPIILKSMTKSSDQSSRASKNKNIIFCELSFRDKNEWWKTVVRFHVGFASTELKIRNWHFDSCSCQVEKSDEILLSIFFPHQFWDNQDIRPVQNYRRLQNQCFNTIYIYIYPRTWRNI